MATFSVTDSMGYTHSLTVTETAYSVEDNTSTVSYTYQLKSGSSYGFSGYGIAWEIYIDGVQVAYHAKVSAEYKCLKGGNTITFKTGTVTIEHDADGTKSIYCYAQAFDIDQSVSYTPDNNIKPSGTLTLTAIPRGFSYIKDGDTVSAYQSYVFEDGALHQVAPYVYNAENASLDMLS